MDALRQYILSVIAATILCSMLTGLLHRGLMHDLSRLICGILLTIILISPLKGKISLDFRSFYQSYTQQAQAAAEEGKRYSANQYAAIIKSKTEAYILDKAAAMNLSVSAEAVFTQDSPPVLDAVYLQGTASPLARQKLSEIITKDLGISKENLIWTG